MDVIHPRLAFVGAEGFTKFWLFSHDFDSRYARTSIKGSECADFGLIAKKTLAKKWFFGMAPKAG